MSRHLPWIANLVLKGAAVLLAANEIRGLILAGPVLYGIYASGGTITAVWVGMSSLAGILLSVLVPLYAAKKIDRHLKKRLA